MDMFAGWFVECAGDDLRGRPRHRPEHVGDFFRPLIDQQYDDVAFRVILTDAQSDLLEQHRLASPWR